MTSMPISAEKGSVLNLDSLLAALILGARQTAAGGRSWPGAACTLSYLWS